MASVLCMVLLFSQNGNFRVAMKKVIECCSGNAKLPRGLRAGNAVGKHLANVFAAVVKASFLIARAETASQLFAAGFQASQRLFGPLADEISFDFRGKGKCESQDFGLDVGAETVIVLYGPDLNFFLNADV